MNLASRVFAAPGASAMTLDVTRDGLAGKVSAEFDVEEPYAFLAA